MDSPSFPTGHSASDARAAEPATARAAPDVVRRPGRSPAPRPARPLENAPPVAPARTERNAAARYAPALDSDIESLVTEDDTPVDNLPSEKQQRLLTEPLYSSWAGPGAGRRFLAAANVGVFPERRNPAIVPDVLLSLDVQVHENWWDKEHRSYFVWEFGKAPDLVVEIVSNRKGEEIGKKRMRYARMGVGYYVVSDPLRQVMGDELHVFRLSAGTYERQEWPWFPELGLGMTLWEGEFEGVWSRWLRWTDAHGELIPTGKQRAEQQQQRAEQEATARQAAETRVQQEAAARQAAEIRVQQEAAARRQEAAARQAAETRVQQEATARRQEATARRQEAAARRQEAAARQAAEARVAELEALLGRRST